MVKGELYCLLNKDSEVKGNLEKKLTDMLNVMNCNKSDSFSHFIDDMGDALGNILDEDILLCIEYYGLKEIQSELKKMKKSLKGSIKYIYKLILTYKDKIINNSNTEEFYKDTDINKCYKLFTNNICVLYKDVFIVQILNTLFLSLINEIASLDELKQKLDTFSNDVAERVFILQSEVDIIDIREDVTSITNYIEGLEIAGGILSDYEVYCAILSAKAYATEILSNNTSIRGKIKSSTIIYLNDISNSLIEDMIKNEDLSMIDFYGLLYKYFIITIVIYYLNLDKE